MDRTSLARFRELVQVFAQGAQRPAEYLTELEAAVQGVDYRHRACSEAGQACVAAAGAFEQDRDFFQFITHGHAALESLAYAAYAAGAIFWPQVFPFGSEAARRAVSGRATARAYDLAGSADFAAQLHAMLDSADFRAWSRYRHVVTHRALAGPRIGADEVAGMRRWLDETLDALLASLVRLAAGQRPHDITLP